MIKIKQLNMKRLISIVFLVFLSTPVFSQEFDYLTFNDSIMNRVLFDEVIAYHENLNNKIELYFSEVGSELHCKGAVEYMKTNGCRHRPSYLYIGSLPKNEAIMVLNDVGIDTSEYSYVGRCEILAKIALVGQTTYQEIAKIAINGWLNSIGHRGTIINLGMFGELEILGISSSYNEKTRSVDIALTLFSAVK